MTSQAADIAAPFWKGFMTAALTNKPIETFTRPTGLQYLQNAGGSFKSTSSSDFFPKWYKEQARRYASIDKVSGKLATIDPKTQAVQIHDPTTGGVIKEITSQVIWPVKGIITLEFGESDLPYQPFHTGIDIASPQGKVGDQVAVYGRNSCLRRRNILGIW